MKNLYAPWRDKYVSQEKGMNTSQACVFCKKISDSHDQNNFILKRTNHCVVCLNLYPYNAGHVLVLSKQHVQSLNELSLEERCELMEAVNHSIEIMKVALNPNGFNIGINLGQTAGAGIPSHLHIHILPRWQGDTNFLPLIGEVKPISFDMNEIYNKLKEEFDHGI